MSKSNLERVQPTPGECTTLSWEPNLRRNQFDFDPEHDLIANIRRKISEIWDVTDVIIIPKRWQMEMDIAPVPLESWADADETIIPFWYGTKPQKSTWWGSVKRLFR
jgi:hypothetical protein